MDFQTILPDLRCPITYSFLEDPIVLPCCQKAVSRVALLTWFENSRTCPCCCADLTDFNARETPKNNTIAGLVESARAQGYSIVAPKRHEWSAYHKYIPSCGVGECTLTVKDSKFTVKPSLFIAVVDASGSMAGAPFEQVRVALRHILGMVQHNKSVVVKIVVYESTSRILNLTGSLEEDKAIINDLQAGGGTNFVNAFHSVREILSNFTDTEETARPKKHCVNSVAVAFLTDGQDGSGVAKTEMARTLRELIEESWTGSINVHALGFGPGCDRELLESMRLAGNIPGTFRYAEPGENADALCQKLTSVFEFCTRLRSVSLTLALTGGTFLDGTNTQTLRFSIDPKSWGRGQFWIKTAGQELSLTVTSEFDGGVTIPVNTDLAGDTVRTKWLSTLVDGTASRLLTLPAGEADNIRKLRTQLLLHYLGNIEASTGDTALHERIKFMKEQVSAWLAGQQLSVNKLSDMRFSTMLGASAAGVGATHTSHTEHQMAKAPLALTEHPEFERPPKHYNRANGEDSGRNILQQAICAHVCSGRLPDVLGELIKNSPLEDVLHCDKDGNNALMLAAYCGHSAIIQALLISHKDVRSYLDVSNKDDETAVTLAIKKRGFHNCMMALMEAGASLPTKRKKALQRYCVDNNYTRTASFLDQFGDTVSYDVDMSMTEEYVRFIYNKYKAADRSTVGVGAPVKFLQVALGKLLEDMAGDLLDSGVYPDFQTFLECCIPPKPDHPEVERYLRLCKMVLEKCPQFLHERDQSQDTVLHVATRKGNLPHVQYFLSRGVPVDAANDKGNSALAVACNMRWPCIVKCLLDNGADVNWRNLKGNTPLFGTCERGPRKIAEELVARGAIIDELNDNGDSTILICCRNGHADVLEFLLEYVDLTFANMKAHIDGFNAIMACAEANRPAPMQVLQKYGVDINQKTANDNKIIAGAAPLHIAAYYGRLAAAEELLRLGATVDITDLYGCTPLHVAVIQGYPDIARLLCRAGAKVNKTNDAGNTPLAYCRERADIRDILISPLADILCLLGKGSYVDEEEVAMHAILREATGWSWASPRALGSVADTYDDLGSTPLTYAALCSRRETVETLLQLGASPDLPEGDGCSPLFWAQHNRVTRISNLLNCTEETKQMVQLQLARLRQYNRSYQILFLGTKPPITTAAVGSTICYRMQALINAVGVRACYSWPTVASLTESPGVLACLQDDKFKDFYESRLLWEAKAHVVRKIATDRLQGLQPEQCLAICMYTNNELVPRIVNGHLLTPDMSPLINTYTGMLHTALTALPPYIGETFLGAPDADRSKFQIGNVVQWQTFISSSTLWRVAMENNPSYTSKSRKGTIFAIQSKSGRLANNMSQYSVDSEVIFLPGVQFKVTNWYHGTVIALGQANIREHSYKVKEADDEWLPLTEMLRSDKSLIIELTEQ